MASKNQPSKKSEGSPQNLASSKSRKLLPEPPEPSDEELFGNTADMRRANQRKRQFKGVSDEAWAENEDLQRELAAARNSPYYWWWAFLRESTDYRMALRGARGEPYASIAQDFGYLGNEFDIWWLRTGREIFAEQQTIPQVRELEHGSVVNLHQHHPKLVLELPLRIGQTNILRQVKKILKPHYYVISATPQASATSKRYLYPESRMRMRTMKILYDVWKARKEYPKAKWREIGVRMRLSPAHIPKKGDSKEEIHYKRRVMALVVQRYYRKAANLIDFAAKGDFPRIK